MSFNQIAWKIFRANFRKYLLYFICCGYTVMIFFIFSTVFTNKSFMTSPQTGMVASAIISPSIVVGLFSVFFILYAYSSFMKYRKTELGTFLVLGMTNTDIARLVVLENSLISILSLAAGMLAGTAVSPLFYLFISSALNIQGVVFSLSPESFFYTLALFGPLFAFAIIYGAVSSFRLKIINTIKSARIASRNLFSKPYWCIVGAAFIVAAILLIHVNVLFGFLLAFAGAFFCISCLVGLITLANNANQKKKLKNILFLSNLRHTYGNSKYILFINTLLVFASVFFIGIGMLLVLQSGRLTLQYNPYDIAFVQVDGLNNVPDATINKIVSNGETPLTATKSLEFILDNNENVILMSDADLIGLGHSFSVQKGNFINLYQVVLDDGYQHDTLDWKTLNVHMGNLNQKFQSQGNIIAVLFNDLPFLSDHDSIKILNQSDYVDIKKAAAQKYVGTVRLFDFQDWRKTGPVNDRLNAALEKTRLNSASYFVNSTADNYMLDTSSKIGYQTSNLQMSSFFIFLNAFVAILFFASSGILLHLKLLTDYDAEKKKYKKLSRIGITGPEIAKTVFKELGVLFIAPGIFGIIVALLICCFLSGWGDALPSILLPGAIYLGLQAAYYLLYRRSYTNKLISTIQ